MVEIGYAISTEEHSPNELIRNAEHAEEAGFEFALVSDHYHPWMEQQGEAPFVWSVLGALANATDDLRFGTGVTCPTIRIHPAIIAQAAATAASMFEGRFFLGLGTGERLNEHILGDNWPPHHVRLQMLEEAIEVMTDLWRGEMTSYDGEYYTVENAQVFTLPDEPPDIALAASGETTAKFAGQFGDALVSTAPKEDVVETFSNAYGGDAPRYGQATVCWANSEPEAKETAYKWWANGALPGELGQELATPRHFEQATQALDEDDMANSFPCSPNADDHIESIEAYVDAGFDNVYIHQVGPEQEAFIDFYAEEVLPSFS